MHARHRHGSFFYESGAAGTDELLQQDAGSP
jgi:hypothetical protein